MKIFLVFCFLILSIEAWTKDGLIGRVTKLRGNVVKIHGDNQVILKEGDNLYAGDEIHTQSGSFIKVIMRDDTVFQLGAKSSFKFGEFSFKTKEDRHAVYELMQGKLRSLFTVPAKEGALKLNTPTASMGIRGTEILSDVYKLDGVLKTDIALLRGKLDVAINEKSFSLKPGEMIESHKFGPESERAPMPPPTVKEIPRQIFTKLQLGDKEGGEVFLFDAKNGTKKEMEPGMEKAPEFKSEIKEQINQKEFQAPAPNMDNRKVNNSQPNQQPPHVKNCRDNNSCPQPTPVKNCRADNSCPQPPPVKNCRVDNSCPQPPPVKNCRDDNSCPPPPVTKPGEVGGTTNTPPR